MVIESFVKSLMAHLIIYMPLAILIFIDDRHDTRTAYTLRVH